MSPHAIVFLLAAALSFAGALLLGEARRGAVALLAALAPPLGLALWFGDMSALGALIILPLSVAGALAGLGAALIGARVLGE